MEKTKKKKSTKKMPSKTRYALIPSNDPCHRCGWMSAFVEKYTEGEEPWEYMETFDSMADLRAYCDEHRIDLEE